MSNKNTAMEATVEIYNKYVLAISSWFSGTSAILLKDHLGNSFLKYSLFLFIITLILSITEQFCNFHNMRNSTSECYSYCATFLGWLGYISLMIALILLILFLFNIQGGNDAT